MSKIKKIHDEDDDIIVDDEDVKEKKADRFFETLPGDKEVKIYAYKKSPISKTWERCGKAKWVSDGDYDYDNIVDDYGAGEYQFIAHIKGENGKLKFLDSCTVRFAEPPKKNETVLGNNQTLNISDLRRQALEEMKLMKEIFPSNEKGTDNSVIILELMKMMQTISEKQTSAMRESEHRMYEALEKIANKSTDSKKEILEYFELFNTFQGGGSESGGVGKMIEMIAPVLPSIAGYFTGQKNVVPDTPIKNITEKPAIKQPSEDEIINNILSKIPEDIKNRLTLENFEIYINNAAEKNPHIPKEYLIKAGQKILADRK